MVENNPELTHQVELPSSVERMIKAYGLSFRPGVEGAALVEKVARLIMWPEELTPEAVEEAWRKVDFKLKHPSLISKLEPPLE